MLLKGLAFSYTQTKPIIIVVLGVHVITYYIFTFRNHPSGFNINRVNLIMVKHHNKL